MTDIQQSSADLPETEPRQKTASTTTTTTHHEKPTSTFKKSDPGTFLEHKIHPIANLIKRSLKAGSIHPMPSAESGTGSARSIEKIGSIRQQPQKPHHQVHEPQQQQQHLGSETSTTTAQKTGITLDPENAREAISTYLVALAPALMTFYRVYFGNNGPTWFSFHPIMMTVSAFSVLGAVLCQQLGGSNNITLVGTLSFTSVLSLFLGLYVIWSDKEMYAKTHFMSMHSHFGGMMIFGILSFALASFWVFNPWDGTTKMNELWQRRLAYWGKGWMGLGLTTMMVGAFEIERTWFFLFLWLGSFALAVPFLILSWDKNTTSSKA